MTLRTTKEVRAHAAAWMAKQDPSKNLPTAKTDHSPLPWAIVQRTPGASPKITDADGEFIAWATASRYGDDRKDPTALANLDYLILAINAHDALTARVAELEAERECLVLDYQGAYKRAIAAESVLSDIAEMRDDMLETTHAWAKNTARAALAKGKA